MDQLFMWEMECEMERSTKETLSIDEQEEICPSLGNHNTQEALSDTLGHIAVSE